MDRTPLMEHFTHPHNAGVLPAPCAVGHAENPMCGDLVELSVRVEHEVVAQARFRAQGCPASIACCSRLTELVQGLSTSAAARLEPWALEEALGGLPVTSGHAARLAVRALKDALDRSRAPPLA